jgi:hypothetical protein
MSCLAYLLPVRHALYSKVCVLYHEYDIFISIPLQFVFFRVFQNASIWHPKHRELNVFLIHGYVYNVGPQHISKITY